MTWGLLGFGFGLLVGFGFSQEFHYFIERGKSSFGQSAFTRLLHGKGAFDRSTANAIDATSGISAEKGNGIGNPSEQQPTDAHHYCKAPRSFFYAELSSKPDKGHKSHTRDSCAINFKLFASVQLGHGQQEQIPRPLELNPLEPQSPHQSCYHDAPAQIVLIGDHRTPPLGAAFSD